MFIELHARSAFSFLEGSSIPEEMVEACAERGMGAMAMLDHDGVFGAPRFYHAAVKKGIRAHIGAEITTPEGWRFPVLVESRAGYQNLCRAITLMKLRDKKGEGSLASGELAAYANGLVCLTGGDEGPLAHALANGGVERATQAVEQLCEIFGRRNVYVELQRHYCREEEARNQAAIEIARKLSLPLLATNCASYAQPQQRELLDVFTCIRHHRNLGNAGRLLTRNAERHLKNPKEMTQLFADLPEAIANTESLSSRLEFSLHDLGYEFPTYPVPDGGTEMQFLRARAKEGRLRRYGANNEKAEKQIERELALIEKLKLPGYFLIVWDIVRFCNSQNILVQGRGSAANSAVCYALGITAVDAVGMGLLFERFLSEERGEWPDIDLDLPSGDQRERAIQYVYERYGRRGAAMTANVITYRGKSAAREIGKALSFDPETLARLASLVSAWEYKDSADTMENHFRDAGFDLNHPKIRKFFELCIQVQDLPRHLGQHSGGLVVCQGQLDSVVPLEQASMPNRVVVQWDKEDCADLGIVKIDLLGLGMMAVLEDSLQIISTHYGEEIDLGHLPQNDEKIYKTLQKADTVGMFQIESRAQMSCLPRLQPKEFYDIVVQVAIIRPGPIVGKMVHPYLARRQGKEAPECLHPSLKPVLERTLGVPLFQEQLLRMAMIAAGFSGGEAEELRRAFGFKRSEKLMRDVEVKLRRGMERNGITGATQDTIVGSITSFALYGFPESHAASFALIAYASAFLKCHYLAAFTAAMLNNQPMGFYSPATLVKDAQRHGLRVRPIDVTKSDWICTLEKAGEEHVMRVGLRYVKGLREEIGREIVRQRDLEMFRSIDDLKLRVPKLGKGDLAALAEIGALNFVGGKEGFHRRDALWQIERVARRPGPLLEAVESDDAMAQRSPLQPMTSEDRLVADFHNTGMTVGPHPLRYHREDLRRQGVVTAIELHRMRNGTPVRVAGSVIARQRPGTAKGFVFLSLEDETGISNAILTPQIFREHHVVVVHQQFLLLEGILQNQENVISVKVQRLQPLFLTKAETVSHDFH
ncbi:MAG TPA: error-prone DNA polymerase [Candidatus Acidoferrum sp.]|nr:error-prone DNA polymerase [Candidatus Acidoferrum sp.]